ncbi:MAG: TolC family protein [Bernardetiaceae bacterium]
MKQITLCFLAFLWGILPLSAQGPTRSLSLEEAVSMAQQNHYEILKAEAQIAAARAQYAQSQGVFLPRATLSATGISTNNPLQAFGILLLQERVAAEDFNPNTLNDPGSIQNFTTSIDVQQPILNFDGFRKREAARLQVDAKTQQKDRARQQIAFMTKQAYYQLALAQQKTIVLTQALEVAKAYQKLTQDNLDAGYVQRADLLAVQLRVHQLEDQLTEATHNVQSAKDFLAFLLNTEDDLSQLTLTDSLTMPAAPTEAEPLTEVSPQRPDLRAYRIGIAATEQLLKAEKQQFLPSLNAFGSFAFNDEIPFGTQANNYLIGMSLQWKLFQGGERIHGIRKIQADKDYLQIQHDQAIAQGNLDIRQALRKQQLAQRQVQTADYAVAQAEEALRVRQNRYTQGLEKTTDLLTSEAKLAETKLHKLLAHYQYLIASAELEFLGQ